MVIYQKVTDTINWTHPAILARAQNLTDKANSPVEIAKSCFEWVRDNIKHIDDYNIQTIACSASEVLSTGAGICYAKSHLLAALLRANSIPAGFCYQRLSRDDNGSPYCLHGFNAVFLPDIGWYRIDCRGNKTGVNAQFTPPREQLAFSTLLEGEIDFKAIFAEPLPMVVEALRTCQTKDELWDNLPDAVDLE